MIKYFKYSIDCFHSCFKHKRFFSIEPHKILIFIGLFIFLPIFFLSLQLPFAYWDWLMVPYYQLQGNVYEWRDLFNNLFFSFFKDTIQFRPISTLILNINYLLFGGEFWLFYIFKWTIFILTITFLYKYLFALTTSKLSAMIGSSIFLLHPMPFVLDVMSQDGYVVLFGSIALFFYEQFKKNPIENNHKLYWSIFFSTLALLSKEIGIAFFIFYTVYVFLDFKEPIIKKIRFLC